MSASADFGHRYSRHGYNSRRDRARHDRRSSRRHHNRKTRYWVEGYYRSVHVPARYGWVYDCGRRIWAEVEPAHYERVWVPGGYRYRYRSD